MSTIAMGRDENGVPREIQTETDGRTRTALKVGTSVHSVALAQHLVISEAPCTLYSVKALNVSGAPAWLHIFDATELPDQGAVPDRIPIPVEDDGVNGDTWGDRGTKMAVGCVAVMSSTLATLTVIAGNNAWFDAEKG